MTIFASRSLPGLFLNAFLAKTVKAGRLPCLLLRQAVMHRMVLLRWTTTKRMTLLGYTQGAQIHLLVVRFKCPDLISKMVGLTLLGN